MDLVGGFLLADGSRAMALTGIDDPSRFCVSATLMPRERTRPVCEGLAEAMRLHAVPEQILTDDGKVFSGRRFAPPVEVLYDRICRENGIEHLLTKPRSPTTTGKLERFHRTLPVEFDTSRVFPSLRTAQGALDEWVRHYNEERPHQSLGYLTPRVRFEQRPEGATAPATLTTGPAAGPADRTGEVRNAARRRHRAAALPCKQSVRDQPN